MDKTTSLDLKEILSEHVQFIRSSCIAFDAGFDGEAKRMAVSVRVLLHDTGNSHSLFNQLGLKGVNFYNTSYPWSSKNLMVHHGLLSIRIGRQEMTYMAMLDDIPSQLKRWNPFKEWWDEIVFDDCKGNQLKRRDIVLGLANKEGGAHVDPQLNSAYKTITRNSVFWVTKSEKGEKAIEGSMERITMRQISHEVIKTIEKHTK